MPVVSGQSFMGTEKHPDAGIFLNYDEDDHSQGCSQTKEAFNALKKDDILRPNISDDDFRSSNTRAVGVGYDFVYFRYKISAKFYSFSIY